LGKLTADGEFIQSSRFEFGNKDGSRVDVAWFGPPFTVLNPVCVTSENTVYELRKKTLVPGRLSWKGEFTPNPKKDSIPFKDYVFSPDAPPIWNLPGVFLPVGTKPWPDIKDLKPSGGRDPVMAPRPPQTGR
jgi:hypothetical protein